MLMNRTNRTLSANSLGLNLPSRSFAQNSGLININGVTPTLRVRHRHHDRMADVMRADQTKIARKYREISKPPISIFIEPSPSFAKIDSSLLTGFGWLLTPSIAAWPSTAQVQSSAIAAIWGQLTVTTDGSGGPRTTRQRCPLLVVRPVGPTDRVVAAMPVELAGACAEG